MSKKNKTYLDLFLDNSENIKKKEKGPYFHDIHEKAILKYNNPETSLREKNNIYDTFINQAFKDISNRVLEMPKFHKLPKSMNKEQLIDETYIRLVEKITKFTPNMIGKGGQPVKAFSYFSTIAKNYILEKKVRHEKILKNKADVETSIDLYILSEDTLKKMSNYDKLDINLEDYEKTFENTKKIILDTIRNIVNNEQAKIKKDEDFIKIGLTLEYLLIKWDKIEFMKKNEFMRILTLYTSLKQQQVSFQFKKFKIAVLKKLKPNLVSKLNKGKNEKKLKDKEIEKQIEDMFFIQDSESEIEDDLLKDDLDSESEIEDNISEIDFEKEQEDLLKEELPEKKYNRFKYGINSMEEFEMDMEFTYNDKLKENRKKNG